MSDQAKTLQEVASAVAEMRQKLETYGANSAEFKNVQTKVEISLATFDKTISDAGAKQIASDNAIAELKGQLSSMEVSLARQSSVPGSKNWKQSEEYKAVQAYVKTGAIDVKTLRVDNSTQGGYLVPQEMDDTILKDLVEISPIRQLSRTRTVSKSVLSVPKRTGTPTAQYEGEMEANPITQSSYGQETLTCHRLGAEVALTMDLLMDAAFDMEAEVSSDIIEQFAYAEGYNFVLGNGIKRPEGFAANATLQAAALETGTSGLIKGDDILALTGQLKVGYNPTFGFNRATLATLRQLKGTSNDHYIWQIGGIGPKQPATLGGMPYVLIQDMANIAVGTYPVVYGDFKQGYMITDRVGMMVVRDQYTQARNAIVVFNFHRWNHGQVVKTEAFKLLKIKA